MTALVTHRASAAAAEFACRLLLNFTAKHDGCAAVRTAGGISAAADALIQHAASRPIAEVACSVLQNVSRSWRVDASLAAAPCISALVAALQHHGRTSAAVAESACNALHSAITRTTDHGADARAAVIAAGGMRAITSALQAHAGSEVVLLATCAVLGELCHGEDAAQAVVTTGIVATLSTALRTHATSVPAMAAAGGALRSLAWNTDAGVVSTVCAAVPGLVAMLVEHGRCPWVASAICDVLSCYAVRPLTKAAVVAAGGLATMLWAFCVHGGCNAHVPAFVPTAAEADDARRWRGVGR